MPGALGLKLTSTDPQCARGGTVPPGKPGLRVAAGLLDLFLGQPLGAFEICLAEVGAVEMCLREQGVSSAPEAERSGATLAPPSRSVAPCPLR